ncbi:MAG: lipocalin family protein [Flavobacteriaceae bacterium]
MRLLGMAGIFILLMGCEKKISLQELDQINGYWEIEKVVFPDGQTKEYTVNSTIDYIQYQNLKGFRKKVHPNLDGSFRTSDDAELFSISIEKSTFRMHYTNDLSQWEEKIIGIDQNHLIMQTAEGVAYHYKRFKGILEE